MGLFKRREMIETLALQSGAWIVTEHIADMFVITNTDHKQSSFIQIRSSDQYFSTLFQLFLKTRFSLERVPPLLFGRLMMRSSSLLWSSWHADIGESTEAIVYLKARIPRSALDLRLFNDVCEEMRAEARAFEKELLDKFDYMQGYRPPAGSSGVPATRQSDTDVLFVE